MHPVRTIGHKMTAPTPGPWLVKSEFDRVWVHGGPFQDDIAEFTFLGEYCVAISKNEAIANATLFVAARELLDALRNLLGCVDDVHLSEKDWIEECKLGARLAIAKATVP